VRNVDHNKRAEETAAHKPNAWRCVEGWHVERSHPSLIKVKTRHELTILKKPATGCLEVMLPWLPAWRQSPFGTLVKSQFGTWKYCIHTNSTNISLNVQALVSFFTACNTWFFLHSANMEGTAFYRWSNGMGCRSSPSIFVFLERSSDDSLI